jgi:hypothetical protein
VLKFTGEVCPVTTLGMVEANIFFQAGTVKFFAIMCYFLCMFALLEKT